MLSLILLGALLWGAYLTVFSKEGYQNFADAALWPFDRILQPIHYWLAQFSPSYYPNLYFPNWVGYYYRPAGPWFEATQW